MQKEGAIIRNMDERTVRAYDKLAKEYDEETADFWDKFPQDFLREFAKLARGRVLNVGSGPGRDGLLLKELGLEVVCLDASRAMVKMCEARGLKAVQGDMNELSFEAGSFDGVWAYTSLLHAKKSEVGKAMNEISRVLKDGGVLGLGLIEGEAEGYRQSSGMEMSRWFSFYTGPEAAGLLSRNGFEILAEDHFQPGSKKYLNFIARKTEVLKKAGDPSICPVIALVRDGRVLIGLRHYTPEKWKAVSVWTIPGGRCDEGETIEETLRREIAEETGITDVRITGFLGVLAGAKQDDVVYAFVGETSEEPKLMEPEKFSEWIWAEPGEIKDFINPATLDLVREHIRKNKLL